jgi:hypothetical protein
MFSLKNQKMEQAIGKGRVREGVWEGVAADFMS